MEKFEFGAGDDDRKRLLNFVDNLHQFLGKLVDEGDYFQAKFRDDYLKSWAELNPHFYALKDALQRTETNALLASGLLGGPLHFKLKVLNHFAEEFLLYGIELVGGHKILKELLAIANKLLASLCATAGAGQAILSFNEFLAAIIKDDS